MLLSQSRSFSFALYALECVCVCVWVCPVKTVSSITSIHNAQYTFQLISICHHHSLFYADKTLGAYKETKIRKHVCNVHTRTHTLTHRAFQIHSIECNVWASYIWMHIVCIANCIKYNQHPVNFIRLAGKRPHIDYSFVTCLKQNDFLYSVVHQETQEEEGEAEMAKKKCGITRFVFAFVCFARILLRVFSARVCLQTKIDINICVLCCVGVRVSLAHKKCHWMEMFGASSMQTVAHRM